MSEKVLVRLTEVECEDVTSTEINVFWNNSFGFVMSNLEGEGLEFLSGK